MNGDELRMILCRLGKGMSLTIPDEWLDTHISGTNAARAALVDEIARQYFCILKPNIGTQTFEKQDVPFTG